MERQHLAAARHQRGFAHDGNGASPPPERRHVLLHDAAMSAKFVQQRRADRRVVNHADTRRDAQHEPSGAVRCLILYDLVVQRGPTEPCWQYLLKDRLQVRPQKRDALASELVKAPDARQVGPQTELPQGAAAVARLHISIVAKLDVEADFRRIR